MAAIPANRAGTATSHAPVCVCCVFRLCVRVTCVSPLVWCQLTQRAEHGVTLSRRLHSVGVVRHVAHVRLDEPGDEGGGGPRHTHTHTQAKERHLAGVVFRLGVRWVK